MVLSVGNSSEGYRCMLVFLYISWVLLVQHVCAFRHCSNEAICAHSCALAGARALEPLQVCRVQGSWVDYLVCSELLDHVPEPCNSGRILVVLCGQEKPQLFIISKVSLVLGATVFFFSILHKTERETLQAEGVLVPPVHPPWVQANAELRATRGLTNYFKPCEGQLQPTSVHSVLHLLDFESGSYLLHP